ncbi:MAG: phosphogluconate dehydrogenase (NAD(+)-dependent, decarboxylating) [Aquificaceae bacterium]
MVDDKLIIFGLGRMGRGISRRLKTRGYKLAVYDINPEAREEMKEGFLVLQSPSEISKLFEKERKIVFIMVPHQAVDEVLTSLESYLSEGDVVIDGGNSYYKDSQRRHERLKEVGVYFMDVGVSGGVYGEEEGYCLMIGGDRKAFELCKKIFRDLSYKGEGYAYLGSSGAGHFAKMVHNGIEYALMEAIGEGFELLKESEFNYDLKEVARIYNMGSVIRSWLLELTEMVFEDFGGLEKIEPYVMDTGEGRWTLLEAIHKSVPASTIAEALFMRFRSRQKDSFRDKLLAALRYEFGRHEIKRKDE